MGLSGPDLTVTLNATLAGGLSGANRAFALQTSGASSLTLGNSAIVTGGVNITSGQLSVTPDAGGEAPCPP